MITQTFKVIVDAKAKIEDLKRKIIDDEQQYSSLRFKRTGKLDADDLDKELQLRDKIAFSNDTLGKLEAHLQKSEEKLIGLLVDLEVRPDQEVECRLGNNNFASISYSKEDGKSRLNTKEYTDFHKSFPH